MTDALEFDLAVDCPPEHAFDVWANRTSLWWPRDHTRSGDPATVVRFEPLVGGRVFERTPDGTEHTWGKVVEWEPPQRLAYRWHIWGDSSEATLVEITFADRGKGTLVTVRHTGWDRLGARGAELRSRNQGGWARLFGAYQPVAEA